MTSIPFIQGPFCASCQVPVESYAYDFSDPKRLVIQVKCHGKQQAFELTAAQVMQRPDIVCFRRRQGFDTTNLAAPKGIILT